MLDADSDQAPVTMNQRRPSWSGNMPAAAPPEPSLWKRGAGVVAGALSGDLGYESGTPVAATPSVKTTKHLEQVTTPGERLPGALGLASDAAEAASPIIGKAALEAGAAVEEAPTVGSAIYRAVTSPMVKGMGEGYVASKAVEKGAEALHARPEVQESASNLAWLLPMLLHAGLRPEIQTGHNVETGNPAGQVTMRGGVGGGIEITPTEVILKGGTTANPKEIRIPRTPRGGPLATQGPTIEGQTVPPPSPAPPPGAPAPPLPMHEITAQDVAEVGDVIAKLPQEMRAQATLETHAKLAELLLQQGKFVGPDGKIRIISNQKQAESLAQKYINEEIGRQDAQAKKAASEPVPAPPAGFTLDENPQTATAAAATAEESPKFQKGDRVVLPDGREGTIAHAHPRMNITRVVTDAGERVSIGAAKLKAAGAPAPGLGSAEGPSTPAPTPGVESANAGASNIAPQPEAVAAPTAKPAETPPANGAGGPQNAIESTTKEEASKGQIIFARHGATKLDKAGANETVAGWTDEPIDERGKAAAAKLADDLKDAGATTIVTSDLPRAKQTAEIVGKKLGIPVTEDSRLRPQHVPETEGLKVGEATPIWEGYENDPDKKPEGGESWNEARTRQDAALADVNAMVAKGEKPIIVTHSRNLEMELGERPKPGGFITKGLGEKGGANEPGKVESAHGEAHAPADHRPTNGSPVAGSAPGSGEPAGRPGESVEHLGQGTVAGDEGVAGGVVPGRGPGALESGDELPSGIRPQEATHAGVVGEHGAAQPGRDQLRSGAASPANLPATATKYKFGSTQANIPAESEAAKALESARARISDSDLAGKGKEIGEGGNHVTVRYGIKGDDTEGVRKFLSEQSPFEATLGKTEKFPVSEHSEGAAPIIAPIEAPELHRLNAELEKHGEFAEPSFKEYKPHATIAYVDPEKADRYVGMSVTEGKKFTVDEVAITDKQGQQQVVKLEGKKPEPRREAWRSKPVEAKPETPAARKDEFSQADYKKQKAALTRALNLPGEDDRRQAVVAAATKAVSEWGNNAWPDDWSRWQRALGDVGVHTDLEDLKPKEKEIPGGFKKGEFVYHEGRRVKVEGDATLVMKPVWPPGAAVTRQEGVEIRDQQGGIRVVKPGELSREPQEKTLKPVTPQIVPEKKSETGHVLPSFVTHGLSKGQPEEAAAPQTKLSLEAELKDASDETLVAHARQINAALASPGIPDNAKAALTKDLNKVEKEQAYRKKHPFTFRGQSIPEKENLAPSPPKGFTIEPGAGHEQPKPATEGRREVPSPASGRGAELARVEPQAGEVARKEQSTEPAPRQRGGERSPSVSGRGKEGVEPGPGTGTGERVSVPAVGEPAGGRGARRTESVASRKNADWFTHPEDFSVSAGTTQRLAWNLKALNILKKVLSGEAKLTDEDRDALAHYVGWGALPHTFRPYDAPYGEQKKWIEAHRQLQELMSEDEITRARASTINAHFTSPQIVRFMWDAAKRLGFSGGTLLEPSMGSGNFFGMMPKAIRGKSQAIGNELDPTTFNIAKLLYPSANLFNKNFVDLMLPDNSVDMVIGNVPFGEEIFDPHYPKLKARIHDYFLVKSLDKLRPGGVAALISSTGTLDKPNERIREVMANKADLIFALRFPATTFEKTAGTHVTTDLLIFQKRAPGVESEGEPFKKVVPVEAPHEQDGGKATDYLNEYFDKHPENMLGKLAISRRMYGSNDLVLLPDKDKPFDEQLKEALERVPKNVIDDYKSTRLFPAETLNLAPENLIDGNYFLGPEGQIYQKKNGATLLNPFIGEAKPAEKDRITKLIKLRDALTDLMYTMKTVPNDDIGNKLVEQKQKALLSSYKAYIDKHGLVRSSAASNVFGQDPYYPRLAALEQFNKTTKKTTPAEIFTRRTIFPREQLTALSANTKDALFQVLNERGRPDLEFMAQLSGKELPELAKDLEDKGLVYRDPVGGDYKMADDYLSGYVRDKLADAKAAVAQGNKEYQANVDALEKVIPADKPIERIAVRPGATWIPNEATQHFLTKFLKQPHDVKVTNNSGTWSIDNTRDSAENISQYGNAEFSATDLMGLALNLKQPTSYDLQTYVNDDGKQAERKVVNQQRTIAARELQERLSDNFSKWMKDHAEWSPKLARLYNDKYNNLVAPKADGSHLTFPGANLSVLRDSQFMPHQRDGIWRNVQQGRGLIAQVVGAGKTYNMIASGAELRRLGLAKKILYAVPNHLVEQWARDWTKLYPGANVMVVGKDDFSAKNRQIAMAKMANNDWDAIIMPHSHFNLMDISAERQRKTLEKDLDELEETIRGMEAQSRGYQDRGSSRAMKRSVKQMEKSKANLEAKIASLANLKSDKAINFDDTGIDTLFVDEAHEYKNLLFYTKMQRVAGLAQGNAKRATRLKMKTDYLLERNNNRGVYFATGTPVQNTMAEMYNMIRYVAPDVLEKAGIRYFDDWAANFGKIITAMELSPDAESYKPRSKFAEFTNVQELQRMFNSFADVKTNEDLPELKALLPKIEGGGPKIVTVKNPDIEPIVRNLVRRAAAIRGEGVPVLDDANKPVMEEYTDPKTGNVGKRVKMEYFSKPKPEEDNMLSVVTEGRLAATDPRLLNPSASGQYSKIHDVVKNVVKEYKDGEANKVTQMIFADRFRYTNPATKKEEFNLYHEIRDLLVKQGIPKNEIAIIHDYDNADKKLALFDEVNEGKVRVLLGSTQKMGAGTNAQRKLIAEHHVDFPWKPGELEQRTGRIERQGNTNPVVRLYWYATEHSFDAYMGQTLEGKAKFIWQALAGKDVGDTITDAASDSVLSYEEMKAIASGNPDVKRKMELEAKIRKQEILSEQHDAQARQRQGLIEAEENRVARFKAGKASMEQAAANHREATGPDGKTFSLEILGEKFGDRATAKEWLEQQPVPLSNLHLKLNGLPIIVEPKLKDVNALKPGGDQVEYLEYRVPYPTLYRSWGGEARGAEAIEGLTNGTYTAPSATLASVVHSAESVLRNLSGLIEELDDAIKFRKDRIARLDEVAKEDKAFDTKELTAARRELREVNQRLGIDEFQAALEQEVASDIDASADKGSGEEEPEEGDSVLRNLIKGESGEARPGELTRAVAEAAGTVGNYVREVARATKLARDLQRGLDTLDASTHADMLRAKDTFEKLKKQGLTQASDAAIYDHLEDPENVPLDARQDDWLDDVALPLDEQNADLYQELTDGGVPVENYVSRSVKSKGGMLDRIARGVRGVGKRGTLSTSAPQTKTRTMMAIESPDGERRVVSIKQGKATMWVNGEPTELGEVKNAKGRSPVENETFPEGEPNSVFYEKGKIVEGPDGYDWKVTQATTKEIEANTDLEYYHSAFASLLSSNIQLSRAVRAMRFLDAYKASPEFKEIAWKGPGNPPKGWKATSLPQLHGYYFEPRTAEVLNDYAERLDKGQFGVLETAQRFLRAAYLINPIVHPTNVAISWGFEKGLTGFAPWKWNVIYKSGNKAINAVLTKNDDFKAALDAGGALQSHREDLQDVHKLFFERIAEGLDKKESWAMELAKSLGIEHGNLLNLLHKPSSIAAWFSSDVMYLQSAYQYQMEHPGVSLADALKEAGRIIPEYRLPSRILDQRWLAKAMGHPMVSWFGAYHYGLLKSFAEAGKAALGAQEPTPGRTKAEESGKGWDRLAMLGLITMVLYPFLDKLAKELTGDEHARLRRSGPAGLVDAAVQVAQGKQDASSAIQKVITPSPITKGAVELGFNHDLFTGHQIYDPHADWQTQVDQIGHFLQGDFGVPGQYKKAETSAQKKRFFWQQAGVQFGKSRAEKVAGDIAASKVGTEAESPEDHANRVERREILDQLRQGNRKPLQDAEANHELTHRQILSLEHRARLDPLEDTVHNFTIGEVEKVLEAARDDKDDKEIKMLEKILREKKARARVYGWQSRPAAATEAVAQ
jgi:N12 class adenine-specific DNA methylase/broad specificity phosphatase PhoE/2'-5' RNA ligase